ncbi:transporter substrate-binding domain-containing protein [Muriventricola aceti]|uniref:transporter substrate-binding domain-containing protein n=1 Tax=Muriventricola aceti TaxID=2981773 RepID=UPI000821470C|nr:transporter substrate-binding domain-containing protein [Muriventricola aceti]MCU6701858.1 transporter substrate-binding domain-containing protein [Muriventricola aceti]SCI77782.1 Sulfate starvation-induced protein 7 [uncultured Flavonifractor sp.]
MKKTLSLVLALAMCLSLAACGNNGTQDQSSQSGSNASASDGSSGSQQGDNSSVDAADSDWAKIESNGTMKIGITYFEPMNYFDDNGELTGFETEFATAVCEKLGVTPEFVEINWDSKIMELQAQTIDCIWNGMTITPELQEALTISDPYIKNYQVVVIRSDNADVYTSTADLVGKTVEAEAGSAGEAAIIGEGADESLKQAEYISAAKQTDTLLEVKTGAADAAVLDFVLAGAMVGQGDYSDLMIIPNLQLSVEEYGVGFRKDSDAAEKVNEAMQALIEDGTLNTLAEKYDLAELLLANQ